MAPTVSWPNRVRTSSPVVGSVIWPGVLQAGCCINNNSIGSSARGNRAFRAMIGSGAGLKHSSVVAVAALWALGKSLEIVRTRANFESRFVIRQMQQWHLHDCAKVPVVKKHLHRVPQARGPFMQHARDSVVMLADRDC